MEEVAARNLGQDNQRQYQIRSRTNPAESYWGKFHGYGLTAMRHPVFYIKDNLPDYNPYMSFPKDNYTYHAENPDHMSRREAAIKEHQRVHQTPSSVYWPLFQPRPPAGPPPGPAASRKNRKHRKHRKMTRRH